VPAAIVMPLFCDLSVTLKVLPALRWPGPKRMELARSILGLGTMTVGEAATTGFKTPSVTPSRTCRHC